MISLAQIHTIIAHHTVIVCHIVAPHVVLEAHDILMAPIQVFVQLFLCSLCWTQREHKVRALLQSRLAEGTFNLRSFKMRGPVIWKEAFKYAKVIISRGKWVLF